MLVTAMKCPFCDHSETKVLDKRDTGDYAVTRRRRECLKCEKRFTTYERVETAPVVVVKKDGKREPFDRDKLRKGILYAASKRPVSNEQIDGIVQYVENTFRDLDQPEITSDKLGSIVMKRLKRVDKVAYIRFASVYREFADLDEFKKELGKLVKK